MSPKATTALRLDVRLLEAMRQVKATDGVPITTQIEMALWEWLPSRGVSLKGSRTAAPAARRRGGSRAR